MIYKQGSFTPKCPFGRGITEPVHFRWDGWAPALTVTLPNKILSRSICWNWHNIPHNVGSREVQGASMFRGKTEEEETCSYEAASLPEAGTKGSHLPWTFIISWASWNVSHPHLEKTVPRTEVVLVTCGWRPVSRQTSKLNTCFKRLSGQKHKDKIERG